MAEKNEEKSEQQYLVENTAKRVYGYQFLISESPRIASHRVLAPGITEVSASEFDAEIKRNKVLDALTKSGDLMIRAKKAGEGLAGVPLKEAATIVNLTLDLDLLRKWQGFETRQEVLVIIINRVAFVEAELAKRKEAA